MLLFDQTYMVDSFDVFKLARDIVEMRRGACSTGAAYCLGGRSAAERLRPWYEAQQILTHGTPTVRPRQQFPSCGNPAMINIR